MKTANLTKLKKAIIEVKGLFFDLIGIKVCT